MFQTDIGEDSYYFLTFKEQKQFINGVFGAGEYESVQGFWLSEAACIDKDFDMIPNFFFLVCEFPALHNNTTAGKGRNRDVCV